MKLGRSILLACLGLAACSELTGTITLNRPLDVVDKKGKVQHLANGSYRAEFEYNEGKREIKLEVKDAIGGKKDVELEILVPAGREVPRGNGSFALLGAEVGQNFDLKGDLTTDVRETSPTRSVESCTYYVRERVCRQVCRDERGRDGRNRRDCHRECYIEDVPRYGQRDVEYHSVITTVTVLADLLDSSSQDNIGKLSVDRQDSQLVYDYQGACLR